MNSGHAFYHSLGIKLMMLSLLAIAIPLWKMWICFMCSACCQFSGMQSDCRFKMLFISKLHYCEKLTKLCFVHCYEQLYFAVVIIWHSMITWWQSAMCRFLHKISRTVTRHSQICRREEETRVCLSSFCVCLRTEWTHLCNISLSCHKSEAGLGHLWSRLH